MSQLQAGDRGPYLPPSNVGNFCPPAPRLQAFLAALKRTRIDGAELIEVQASRRHLSPPDLPCIRVSPLRQGCAPPPRRPPLPVCRRHSSIATISACCAFACGA